MFISGNAPACISGLNDTDAEAFPADSVALRSETETASGGMRSDLLARHASLSLGFLFSSVGSLQGRLCMCFFKVLSCASRAS